VPISDWLRGPLAPHLRRISRGPLVEYGCFDGRIVKTLIDAHVRGTADNGSVLWPLLALGCWLDACRLLR
jgi:hypothetical protein